MGDVAQILSGTAARNVPVPPPPETHNPSQAMKLTGMPKQVVKLLAGSSQDPKSAVLPPIVPAFTQNKDVQVKVGNKTISSAKPARPWTWAPFASSSRTDGAMFRHWVRANVEYTDYPYAKFDIHLDPVSYSDEEYRRYLKSDMWTKSETDQLMELARKFELRWPVIHDRWLDYYQSPGASRNIEDLQERYYNVAAIIMQTRIVQEATAESQALAAIPIDPTAEDVKEKTETILLEGAAARALATSNPRNQPLIPNVGTGSTNKMFDVSYERERRAHMDRLWRRSKQEEIEEMELRKELKVIDAQLRKLKKSGGHILAATGAGGGRGLSSGPNSRNPSRSVSPVPGANIADTPGVMDESFASTAPTPMPGTPYLQSKRQVPPAMGGSAGLNKTLLTRMDQVLGELKVPTRPLPTKRVCDLYDSVRKDVIMLLTLQKMIMQKEGNLQSKRVRLSKLGGGDRVLDEEALLGIQPPPPPPAPAPAPSKTKVRPKPKPATTSAKKATGKPKAGETQKTDAKDPSAKKAKSAAKRKRKPEAKAQGTPAVGSTAPVQTPKAPTAGTTPTTKSGTKAAASKSAGKTSTAKTPSKTSGAPGEVTGVDTKQPSAKKRARTS